MLLKNGILQLMRELDIINTIQLFMREIQMDHLLNW